MTGYVIELQAEADAAGIDEHALERLAARVLEAESVAQPAELSLLLADDSVVRELNRTYRGTDAATDVLSFAQGEGERFARPEGQAAHLGDVVISLDTARQQAREFGLGAQDEVAHLLVHGILHLLGYDHAEPEEHAAMFGLQKQLLKAWQETKGQPGL